MRSAPFKLALIFVFGLMLPAGANTNSKNTPAASSIVQRIVSDSPDIAGEAERLNLLRKLSSSLSSADVNALTESLGKSKPEFHHKNYWDAFRNDVLDTLLRQKRPSVKVFDTVESLLADNSDVVMQDYALQKLDTVIALSETQKRKGRLTNLLTDYAKSDRTDIQGTAIATLARVVGSDSKEFDEVVMHAMQSEAATRSTRITCCNVASQREIAGAVSAAKAIVIDTKSPPRLRVAAIALIGKKGATVDKAFLQDQLSSPATANAAQVALDLLISKE